MTKLLPLQTVEHGLRRAISLLGDRGVEQAIKSELGLERSASLIRKCSDPDDTNHHLQVRYAVALDRACLASAGQAPLLETMQYMVTTNMNKPGASAEATESAVLKELAMLQAALGTVADRIIIAQSPDSPHDGQLTEAERHEIFEAIDVLERHAEVFKSIITHAES